MSNRVPAGELLKTVYGSRPQHVTQNLNPSTILSKKVHEPIPAAIRIQAWELHMGKAVQSDFLSLVRRKSNLFDAKEGI
jgi:hypothetical protein